MVTERLSPSIAGHIRGWLIPVAPVQSACRVRIPGLMLTGA